VKDLELPELKKLRYIPGIRQSMTFSENYSNVSELDNVKLIARRLFEIYDKDKSSLSEPYEITPMLQNIQLSFILIRY